MSLRRLIVDVDTEDLNVSEFCAQHGISTWFFYTLRRRATELGRDAALEPRSRAPHRVANRTSAGTEDAIVAVRKELTDAGLDAGPASIAYHLKARDVGVVPAEATIWRVLHRRGFITTDPSKAPKRSARRFQAERANERWQADDTHWPLADGTEVKIINIVDDCTRTLVASRAAPSATAEAIFAALAIAAGRWGWPERVLWDNAKAHVNLDESLTKLGIASGHSRPYHPQTCGKVERFHQTLQRWLTAQNPAANLDKLQSQLDAFEQIYNHKRPHRTVGRRPPAKVWATTPKSGPAAQPLGAPTQILYGTVHSGTISAGFRYRISVGSAYNNQSAITVITGLDCHVFINGRLTRHLTLDPTRRGQPLYNRPGRPKTGDTPDNQTDPTAPDTTPTPKV